MLPVISCVELKPAKPRLPTMVTGLTQKVIQQSSAAELEKRRLISEAARAVDKDRAWDILISLDSILSGLARKA